MKDKRWLCLWTWLKVDDHLLCTIEPDNKHSDNAIVVKSANDDIVGHIQETPPKNLFNYMKSQQIEIMDNEVNCDPRPDPKEKWIIGGGIEIPCKYRLNVSESVSSSR